MELKGSEHISFFSWLLLRDRLNTIALLRRKNMFLVHTAMSYVWIDCPFAQACWTFLDINWDTTLDFQTMLLWHVGDLHP